MCIWRHYIAAAVATIALAGAGCPGVRAAYQQRVAEVHRSVPPPADTGRYQVGFALGVDALERMAAQRIARAAREGELPEELALAAPLAGLAAFAVTPQWDATVVRVQPATTGGPAELALLAATGATVRASAGPLAMEQPVRLSVRAVVELEAEVGDRGDVLVIRARLADPGQLRLRVLMEGMPPGVDVVVSAAAEAHVQQALREHPPEPWVLFQLGAEQAREPLPLGAATVGCFPEGRSTVYVGLQTTLPVAAPPGVDAAALDPGPDGWVLQIDQDPLAVLLARAALDGRLGGPLGWPSDHLDLLGLALHDDGFVADLRLWRTGPAQRTVDLQAGGGVALREQRLALTVRTLEQDSPRPVVERALPWTVEVDIPRLPLTFTAVQTVEGALVIRGGVGEEEP